MICRLCGMRPAVTAITHSADGQTETVPVCQSCAVTAAVGAFGPNYWLDTTVTEHNRSMSVKRCPTCSLTYRDIVESGRVGCPDCYKTFSEQLASSVKRLHGQVVHIGRKGCAASADVMAEDRLKELRNELRLALEQEQYERCALLRDQIRALEEGGVGHELA